LGYISCGYIVYNTIADTGGKFPDSITYRVWDMIISKRNGYDFMVQFAAELLRIAVTSHRTEYFLHASELRYTDEEYETAFRKCVPPRNSVWTCQIPECAKWLYFRRHHCRRCGNSICGSCSRFPDSSERREDRFCTQCSGEVPRVPQTKPTVSGRRLTSGERLPANRRYRDSPVLLDF